MASNPAPDSAGTTRWSTARCERVYSWPRTAPICHAAARDAATRHRDDVRARLPVLEPPDQLHAVHARHVDVGDHEVHGDVIEHVERGLGAGALPHLVARALERAVDALAHQAVVVN